MAWGSRGRLARSAIRARHRYPWCARTRLRRRAQAKACDRQRGRAVHKAASSTLYKRSALASRPAQEAASGRRRGAGHSGRPRAANRSGASRPGACAPRPGFPSRPGPWACARAAAAA